jgi:hypothetical protein
MRALTIPLLLCLSLTPAVADDGAASIAAGGLVMRREPRITMAKEVLTISQRKIVVDYDFRNDTDADIATEVAFPVPPYTGEGERGPSDLGFDDFKLWVENERVQYEIETRAFVHGHEVTTTLRQSHIDIASFGHEAPDDHDPAQIRQLSIAQKQLLLRAGILAEGPSHAFYANWSVHKRYYWLQTFPAHSTIRIRHEYTPVLGYSQVAPDSLDPATEHRVKNPELRADTRFNRREFTSLCPSPERIKTLSKAKSIIFTNWVDFILTTANTWKRPIEDFTLNVERTDPKETVSFCWNGPVEQLDANHFTAHATNLIPTKNLHIGFYHLDTRFNEPSRP